MILFEDEFCSQLEALGTVLDRCLDIIRWKQCKGSCWLEHSERSVIYPVLILSANIFSTELERGTCADGTHGGGLLRSLPILTSDRSLHPDLAPSIRLNVCHSELVGDLIKT